ncbi:class I SAM-dependent methyltransferase [Candidatus Neptunochlamydia vexilliferae]|nr:class I SAM-dependent methyltransferase [Candidatus Neptunochlamydia vexilliferae]
MDLPSLLIRKHRGCYLKYLSWIHAIEVKTIVEIGVFRGKNAQVLREQFPDAHLYLIDPWKPDPHYLQSGSAVSDLEETYAKAFRRVQTLFADDPKVTLIQKMSHEAAPLVPDNVDLVFIDANHAYEAIRQDILTWKEKVRPGGILSGHNYGRPRLPGVKQAVDELFGEEAFLGQDEVWFYLTTT